MAYTKFVHSFLEESAQRFPEKPAFFAEGKWYTFSHIEQKANQLARLFKELNIRRGDRVAFYIENSVEYVITYYATLKVGAITVALNTELTADNVDYILQDCNVRYLLIGQKFLKRLGILAEKPYLQHFLIWDTGKTKVTATNAKTILLPQAFESLPASFQNTRIIDLDVASIVYTSGSTGEPRGATLTHLNIVTNTRSIVDICI